MAHQQRVAAILLVACATMFYALTSQAEARKELLNSDFVEARIPAKAPTQSYPDYCRISGECVGKIAASKLSNTNLEDVNCCKSVVAKGEECLMKALAILHEAAPEEFGEDTFAWGEKAWDHCVVIAN